MMTSLSLDGQLFEWFRQDFCLRQGVDDFLLNAFLDLLLLPFGADGGGGARLPGDDAVLCWLGSPAAPLRLAGPEQILSIEGLKPLIRSNPLGIFISPCVLVEDLAEVEDGAG